MISAAISMPKHGAIASLGAGGRRGMTICCCAMMRKSGKRHTTSGGATTRQRRPTRSPSEGASGAG
jgi:hypothetical protein